MPITNHKFQGFESPPLYTPLTTIIYNRVCVLGGRRDILRYSETKFRSIMDDNVNHR